LIFIDIAETINEVALLAEFERYRHQQQQHQQHPERQSFAARELPIIRLVGFCAESLAARALIALVAVCMGRVNIRLPFSAVGR
jgi:hypothetical protein